MKGQNSTKNYQLVKIDVKSTCLDIVILYATGRQSRKDNGDISTVLLAELPF